MEIWTVVYELEDGFIDDVNIEAETKEEAEAECLMSNIEPRKIVRTHKAL